MRHFRITVIVITSVVASLVVSCGDESPTRPSTPTQAAADKPLTIVGVQVEGPDLVEPGATAQYKATMQMSDGSTRDGTGTVNWSSTNRAILSVGAGGLATAGVPGQVTVTANAQGRRATVEVLVLAAGTFRVTGTVREAGLPVGGASVDVINGSIPVKSTRTDSNGTYRLFGLAGNVEVRVSKDGYDGQVLRLQVSGNINADVELAQTAAPRLAGTYQLTISASQACRTTGSMALPAEARSRTFRATITQDGPRLTVTLAGDLLSGSFTGRAEPTQITFDLRGGSSLDYYYYYYNTLSPPFDVLEQFSPSTVWTAMGHATLLSSGNGWRGPLAGAIAVMQSPVATRPQVSSQCSGQHIIEISR